MNSWAIAASANEAKANIASARGFDAASVSSATATVIAAATAAGRAMTRQIAAVVPRRQASTRPIPVKSTSRIARGVVYRSNHGAASDDFWPVQSSEMSGKN